MPSRTEAIYYHHMLEKPQAYTVTAITRMIKNQLEASFADLWVEGEISNYHYHASSGHRYFSLKDDKAVLRTTIWRSQGAYLKFEPEDGQKVLAFGNITVYERGGQYQLNCRKLVPVGVGPLELAFRQLYEKLSREGLFDDDRKLGIPEYPRCIGVVTSPTGAAIRDILNVGRRRNDTIKVIIFPSQVQGDGAEHTIAAGIEYFNTRDDVDVIIIGRGGGSLEDLWPFNTEITVRAVAASDIPVVSAVGHEVDFTLSDYVADLRAPTPSAAAELAFWSKQEFSDRVGGFLMQQTRRLNSQVSRARLMLTSVMDRPVFVRPMDLVLQRQQALDNQRRHLTTAGKNRFDGHKNRLSLVLSQLDALSPLRVLQRGYSVSRHPADGRLIKSSGDVEIGERIETILANGRLQTVVEKKFKSSVATRVGSKEV